MKNTKLKGRVSCHRKIVQNSSFFLSLNLVGRLILKKLRKEVNDKVKVYIFVFYKSMLREHFFIQLKKRR